MDSRVNGFVKNSLLLSKQVCLSLMIVLQNKYIEIRDVLFFFSFFFLKNFVCFMVVYEPRIKSLLYSVISFSFTLHVMCLSFVILFVWLRNLI